MSDDAYLALLHGRRVRRLRTLGVSIALAVVAFAAFCWSIAVGDFPIPVLDVPGVLLGQGSPKDDFIVNELRLPRAVVALLVGAAFGISGAIFQALTRNPLASPDIIGITAGASATAVFGFIVLDLGGTSIALAAVLGGLTTSMLIYALAWRRGMSAYRLVLVGIGIAAMAMALTSYLLSRAELYEAREANLWLTGSLNGRGWEQAGPLLVAMAVLIPIAIALIPKLRTLQLSEDTARGLGVRVNLSRSGLILVAAALASVATATAGPVAFVAFVAGPIARRLVNGPLAVLPAALVGAALVLASDVVGRRLFEPTEIPVGIITALVGAPYLILLLARANRVGRGG
ncbi:iron ABC transporter permease [Nocardioides marmoriginsengisoli]|uniref:Iron ABC transporter permease n=1 Tax=Nocardioides marmoriginsengisoli TaxID=661483 RepID=A0A3N0CJY5_9ACTN|nr:iron chelate uptake ABC transporter family permease subunit [Nocardioides marmoriginsengisoli]RNL63767.1 iron ABC transporter permease [Nocardioides marmoriginsengisoli]